MLKDKKAFKQAVDALSNKYKNKKIDKVVAVEARGFILGGAVAHKVRRGFCAGA